MNHPPSMEDWKERIGKLQAEAWAAGKEWGASLQVGQAFAGCEQEALARYSLPLQIQFFRDAAFIEVQKRRIHTDENGIIDRIVLG